MSMYEYRNQLGSQCVTVINWPIVLFALVFEALGEEIKLLLVVFGLLVMTVRFRADIDLRMPRYVPLLILIIVFGLLSGVLNGQLDQFGIYKFVRDVAYYASPFLLWIFGCNIGKVIAEEDGFWTTLFAMSAAAAVGTIVVGVANNGIALTMSSFKANELMIYAVVLFAMPPENWRWRKKTSKCGSVLDRVRCNCSCYHAFSYYDYLSCCCACRFGDEVLFSFFQSHNHRHNLRSVCCRQCFTHAGQCDFFIYG